MIGSSSRSWLLWGLLLALSFFWLSSPTNAQDSVFVYIGNVDGSPFHVPYRGIVDIPIWIMGPRIGGGLIGLITSNDIVSERLGGNFYLAGQYNFSAPEYHETWSWQELSFMPTEWHNGIFHLADFTVRTDIDSLKIGDTLDALQAYPIVFSDTSGEWLFPSIAHVSQLAIDDFTSADDPDNIPEAFVLHLAYPNPFNSSTTISFFLAEPSEVSLCIYDIAGRKVRLIDMGIMPIGERSVVWDGTDDNHAALSSGTYFYRLECGDNAANACVTLLK